MEYLLIYVGCQTYDPVYELEVGSRRAPCVENGR